MLLRNKKKIDINKNKWIGVGGKFEADESPEECLLREVKEETGLTLTEYKMRGIITFISDEWETEYMYLYTAGKFEGNIMECDEGELKWIPKDELFDLTLWEGDKVFLKMLIENSPFFSMKLVYTGNTLKDIQTKIYE